jgi:hypothetical protein
MTLTIKALVTALALVAGLRRHVLPTRMPAFPAGREREAPLRLEAQAALKLVEGLPALAARAALLMVSVVSAAQEVLAVFWGPIRPGLGVDDRAL